VNTPAGSASQSVSVVIPTLDEAEHIRASLGSVAGQSGRACCTHLPFRLFHYGDQGIFVRRATFEALDGFREWPLMEDVDFLARLRRAGRTVIVPLPVTTSARRFARQGVLRQQLRNAALVLLFHLGVPPARLAAWYGTRR